MPTGKETEFPSRLVRLADLAKALAHPGRLRILEVLAAQPGCVCGDIVGSLPLAQSTVSQHLKELKRVGLIQGEIAGPCTCYCLDRSVIAEAAGALASLFAQLGIPERKGS